MREQKEYYLDYSKIEHYGRVKIKANSIDEAVEKLYRLEEDGELYVNDSEQFYVKVYDCETNKIVYNDTFQKDW